MEVEDRNIIFGPGPDGKQQALTTVTHAANYLGVPVSSLNYYLLKGVIRWVHMGPYRLIDAEKARVVLQRYGYKSRRKVAA